MAQQSLPRRSLDRAKHAARNLAIALGCVIVVGATLIYAGYGADMLGIAAKIGGFVYTPYSIILLVALGLEYVFLKSADRTRLLQMELDKLREKRRQDITTLRLTREGLEELKQRLDGSAAVGDAAQLRGDLERLVDRLRPPEARLLGDRKDGGDNVGQASRLPSDRG